MYFQVMKLYLESNKIVNLSILDLQNSSTFLLKATNCQNITFTLIFTHIMPFNNQKYQQEFKFQYFRGII